ncbi:hypothetical protein D9613_012390 [Agrocybe pediades]|uniref:NodB homology domain-containing protein n=1 Tax=Agrocybe pediades TaxID=84607 RepID=A0A8H4QRZ6_9AGAR|nr:hypothetical protein D9613_012390 [Agrocybe pediades]
MFNSNSLRTSILVSFLLFSSLVQAAVPDENLVRRWDNGEGEGGDASGASAGGGGKAQVITKCSVSGTVALTFDDGPYNYLNDAVDELKKAGAKATFFFNGNNWGCIYDDANVQRVKYAYDNGFQIASHTWAHKDLKSLSREDLTSEFTRTQDAIEKITGVKVAYTRPPYGNYNDLVLQVAYEQGQTLVNWDFDSGDSVGVAASDQKARYDKIVQEHPETILSLEHEVHDTSIYDVLPYAIQKLQKTGYKLVTLAECLGTQPYHNETSSAKGKGKDDTWTCS